MIEACGSAGVVCSVSRSSTTVFGALLCDSAALPSGGASSVSIHHFKRQFSFRAWPVDDAANAK